MFRFIENDLKKWKDEPDRKPLLLRGARQVGKSYTIEKFGRDYFASVVLINFEFERKFHSCFETLDPNKIIRNLTLITKQPIQPGKTLLFLDEIQECPNAILALRYFKEMLPELHVIAAGSLLEFTLNNPKFRMPVGRVQSLYMKPCSFQEFLIACDYGQLIEHLAEIEIKAKLDQAIHQLLLEKINEYFIVGGMPEIVAYYSKHKDFYQCQRLQASLLEFYQKDFGKYDQRIKLANLQKIFDKLPGMITQHFKYVNVDPHTQTRVLKPALEALIDAGLVYPVYHTSASGLPLSATLNEKKFKLLFVDIGLVNSKLGVPFDFVINRLELLTRGALAEQFVGQELLAYGENYKASHLYFWEREKKGSSSEIDYIIHIGSQIFPIEVKSGKTGSLKSLQIFLQEKLVPFGIRISPQELSFHDKILSVPLYMIHELPRLVKQLL